MVAAHADRWNVPGGDTADAAGRSAPLDRYGTDIGRDPAPVTRSAHLQVSSNRADVTRSAVTEAVGAGVAHIVVGLPAPYPAGVARSVTGEWVADEWVATAV